MLLSVRQVRSGYGPQELRLHLRRQAPRPVGHYRDGALRPRLPLLLLLLLLLLLHRHGGRRRVEGHAVAVRQLSMPLLLSSRPLRGAQRRDAELRRPQRHGAHRRAAVSDD